MRVLLLIALALFIVMFVVAIGWVAWSTWAVWLAAGLAVLVLDMLLGDRVIIVRRRRQADQQRAA